MFLEDNKSAQYTLSKTINKYVQYVLFITNLSCSFKQSTPFQTLLFVYGMVGQSIQVCWRCITEGPGDEYARTISHNRMPRRSVILQDTVKPIMGKILFS